MPQHEPDVNNFSSPSTRKPMSLVPSPVTWPKTDEVRSTPPQDRMPTVSASQALRDLNRPSRSRLSTGLAQLDHVQLDGAAGCSPVEPSTSSAQGVVSRGQITEIYGPPGVGKTTLAYVDLIHHPRWCLTSRTRLLECRWRSIRCELVIKSSGWVRASRLIHNYL